MQFRPPSHHFERDCAQKNGRNIPDRQPFADRRGLPICAFAQPFEALWFNCELKTVTNSLMDILLEQWQHSTQGAPEG